MQAHRGARGDIGLAGAALAQLREVNGIDEHGEEDDAGDLVEELADGHGRDERECICAYDEQAQGAYHLQQYGKEADLFRVFEYLNENRAKERAYDAGNISRC